jgi:hypothetical protein
MRRAETQAGIEGKKFIVARARIAGIVEEREKRGGVRIVRPGLGPEKAWVGI